MTVLVVSNNFFLLENLCNGLSSILPNAKRNHPVLELIENTEESEKNG